MSDQGTHFLNKTIKEVIEEFNIDHQKSTPYNSRPMEHWKLLIRFGDYFNKYLKHTM